MRRELQLSLESRRKLARILVPCGMFLLFFLWAWRMPDLFNTIPEYGDILEILWGAQWYYDLLFVQHTSPLFTSLVFHPQGWHTATLANTPTLLVVASLLYGIAGAAFAYNFLCLLSLPVVFTGTFRFARLYVSWLPATVAAIIFTFAGFRWFRVAAHLNVLWASSLLPWLLYGLERIRRSSLEDKSVKLVWFTGLIWGAMINVLLYNVFFGVVAFVIWGKQLLHKERILQGLGISGIALMLGAPVMLVTGHGLSQDRVRLSVFDSLHWGASLNSLVVPFIGHPVAQVRAVARAAYAGPLDESGSANLGTVTFFLAIVGIIYVLKDRRDMLRVVGLTSVGLILSLGLLLKWNGEVIVSPLFQPINRFIWNVGYFLKPALFSTSSPEVAFEGGFPLPAFLLVSTVPFAEAARTFSRYALIGGLGLIVLAAYGVQKMRGLGRYVLVAIWLLEALPVAVTAHPVPLRPHPAYEWLAQQAMPEDEGIVELEFPSGLSHGGQVVFATAFHRKPTVSGLGSFRPPHASFLAGVLNTYIEHPLGLSYADPEVILRPYHIRYIFVHNHGEENRIAWNAISRHPAFHPVECFDPLEGISPWPYPICVAEFVERPSPINLILREGWSRPEEWGIWATGRESQAVWVATSSADHRLEIEAFPLCLPHRYQQLVVEVNGHPFAQHQWVDCKTWDDLLIIPADWIEPGWNTLTMRYGYDASLAGAGRGSVAGSPPLAVGFIRLTVEDIGSK